MRPMTAVLAVVLVASACGGSGGESTGVASLEGLDTSPAVEAAGSDGVPDATPTTTEPVSSEEAMLAFTQCLREAGIDIDDPVPDAEGNLRLSRPEGFEEADREAFRAAREACSEFIEGVTFGFDERDVTEIEDTLYEYASCMRDNGFDMPDPDLSARGPGSGGGGGGVFGSLDRSDPAFEAADEVCREVFGSDGPIPGRGGGFGGGGRPPAGGGDGS